MHEFWRMVFNYLIEIWLVGIEIFLLQKRWEVFPFNFYIYFLSCAKRYQNLYLFSRRCMFGLFGQIMFGSNL